MKAWQPPPGPRGKLPAAMEATWPRHEKRPASNFATAFEGRLLSLNWGRPLKETKR